ncbi:MAG: hypothetical protein CVV41_10640 [Candidatus Riflebacteria bacterium HGW-Riflebacteria-1]|jgi:hypothetical protein|nr:MAG: hypothetical protein CVV41_10640 [Candidatus Riflebacteria bacterium HGW-Riflebacteria-1]
MKKKTECVELQSRMVEYFANPPTQVPDEMASHVRDCAECHREFAELQQVLKGIHDSAEVYEAVPQHLLAAVETRLDSVQQLRPAVQSQPRERNLLILQYSYLASLAVIIWLSMMLIQPMLTVWLSENGLVSSFTVLDEYGLFLAFFAAGGLFAMISSPLIIKTAVRRSNNEKKFSILRWLFSTSIRTFAC